MYHHPQAVHMHQCPNLCAKLDSSAGPLRLSLDFPSFLLLLYQQKIDHLAACPPDFQNS
jgi:hypothetical protein